MAQDLPHLPRLPLPHRISADPRQLLPAGGGLHRVLQDELQREVEDQRVRQVSYQVAFPYVPQVHGVSHCAQRALLRCH